MVRTLASGCRRHCHVLQPGIVGRTLYSWWRFRLVDHPLSAVDPSSHVVFDCRGLAKPKRRCLAPNSTFARSGPLALLCGLWPTADPDGSFYPLHDLRLPDASFVVRRSSVRKPGERRGLWLEAGGALWVGELDRLALQVLYVAVAEVEDGAAVVPRGKDVHGDVEVGVIRGVRVVLVPAFFHE